MFFRVTESDRAWEGGEVDSCRAPVVPSQKAPGPSWHPPQTPSEKVLAIARVLIHPMRATRRDV